MLWVSIMFLDPIFGLGLSVILHLIFYNSITFIISVFNIYIMSKYVRKNENEDDYEKDRIM
ncbi:hypothetical protein [Plasmodium yoelii yoelii]|uniref:Uncharacterized protein n=2 Tax=Plasmodium yoelii yoelii TaxID=73239 RepID=Q7REQ2_PLAYO|nr:hypothetical protein [Plasmodium yoelii yoelii]